DGAREVPMETELRWSGAEVAYIELSALPDTGAPQSISIVAAGGRAHIPDASALRVTIPPKTQLGWRGMTNERAASVDDIAAYDFFGAAARSPTYAGGRSAERKFVTK